MSKEEEETESESEKEEVNKTPDEDGQQQTDRPRTTEEGSSAESSGLNSGGKSVIALFLGLFVLISIAASISAILVLFFPTPDIRRHNHFNNTSTEQSASSSG